MNSPTRPVFSNHYKVYINHTDAGGIVYHANHLTFFENCRRDWLASLGFDGYFFGADGAVDETSGQQGKIHFVVNHADVKYKSPLFVDDNLIVTITDVVKKSASLIITQHIYRDENDFNHAKVATIGVISLVCVTNGKQGIRPCRLPMAFGW